jgi:hypothetical protein
MDGYGTTSYYDYSKMESIWMIPDLPPTECGLTISSASQPVQHSVQNLFEAIIESDCFNSMFDRIFLSSIRTHAGEASAEKSSLGTAGSTSSSVTSNSRQRKHQTRGPRWTPPWNEGDDSNDSDQGHDKDSKRRRASTSRRRESGRLACPFFKFDPSYFKKDMICGTRGWVSTHRLK